MPISSSTLNVNERTRHARRLAEASLHSYALYVALGEREADEKLKELFSELAFVAKDEFTFWGTKGVIRGDAAQLSMFRLWWYLLLRKFLGAVLMMHFLLNSERARLAHFEVYCVSCIDQDERHVIETMMARSQSLAGTIDAEHLKFFSYTLLGMNDALIEISGALIGFSLALKEPRLVAAAGIITGLTATVSIASSAYLQAEHALKTSPHRAAFIAGTSYLAIACMLVLPFILSPSVVLGGLIMFATMLALVAVLALYSSIILQRSYKIQFFQMMILSFGVSLIAFSIGYVIDYWLLTGALSGPIIGVY